MRLGHTIHRQFIKASPTGAFLSISSTLSMRASAVEPATDFPKTSPPKKEIFMSNHNRREFVQLMGIAAIMGSLKSNIAKALTIPANNSTGTIRDVEHIVILMQENRPFDHQFGTLSGVRGFNDPRAVKINLPLASGTGSTPVSVFLQPAGAANVAAGFGVAPNSGNLGGPADGAPVIPPFRVNPEAVSPGLTTLGGAYLPGTDHSWSGTHEAWNQGQYDMWPIVHTPIAMSYVTREDIPYHYALADAFTIGDAYYCSMMGPTNPNRCYLWTGCVGNVNYLGAGGTDGQGAGVVTGNGLSPNNAYYVWQTFPEVLQAAGVSWKVYQDLAGQTFSPDFGDGTGNSFAGNFTDNSLLYFNQYATAAPNSPLFQGGATGTQIINDIPSSTASEETWRSWAEGLFADFRSDVKNGTLPQVSWVVAPAGYSEHPDYPIHYGSWYISQILDILVSHPEVFSKTVFILNYDEADGSFDHMVPPAPPQSAEYGASTVSIENEIVTTVTPAGPIGLGTRVSMVAISPWSKGGYVNSEVFDHTSVIQFIEKRFGVFEKNISPWRRAVAGDLTSVFNFVNPNSAPVSLPTTSGDLPSVAELGGGSVTTFTPTLSSVTVGVPAQEKGIRPARALPYELNVYAAVDASSSTISLEFINTGRKTAVFHVRSGNIADTVRYYTVEPGKTLTGTWNVVSTYSLSVYGPNGFVRYFNGSLGSTAAILDVRSSYEKGGDGGSIQWQVRNLAGKATVSVLNAYSGELISQPLEPQESFGDKPSLQKYYGWYDFIVTVEADATFQYRLAGHVETGKESFSDPAMGGLVTLGG
jgi:phospholipase C